GWGMATATYPGYRSPGAARVRILPDGAIVVSSATQDIGTGTYTTMAQVAADALGVSPHSIRVELGDSDLPPAPVSGGSMTTASVTRAVKAAAEEALLKLKRCAIQASNSPLHGLSLDEIHAEDGCLRAIAETAYVCSKSDTKRSVSYGDVLRSAKLPTIEADA